MSDEPKIYYIFYFQTENLYFSGFDDKDYTKYSPRIRDAAFLTDRKSAEAARDILQKELEVQVTIVELDIPPPEYPEDI